MVSFSYFDGGTMNHPLKTWPGPFQAVWDGVKLFEYRVNDRDFKVGDMLALMEYDPVFLAQLLNLTMLS